MNYCVYFIIVIGNIILDSGMLFEACSNDGESTKILGGNGDMTLNKEDYELGMICQWTIEAAENMVRIVPYLFLC